MKRAMENQSKSAVLQWIIPFAVPMVVVLVILFNFAVKSKESAQQIVTDDMLTATKRYAEILAGELDTMSRAVRSVCSILEQDGTLSDAQAAALMRIAADSTEADNVEFCDSSGKGIDQSGNEISIEEEQYFQNILETGESLLYVGADEHIKQESVVVVERLANDRFMLLFYPVEKLNGLLADDEALSSSAFLALIDAEGMVLSSSGADSRMLDGGNLLETVRTNEPGTAETISACVASGSEGTVSVQVSGEKRMLIYSPLGMNQWGIVMGVEQAYVDGLAGCQWKNTKSMLTSLIVVIFVFSCILMVIDAIGKKRDDRQKKELENKADTDLLTGLNNKLATERKIKNYIAQNPQVQSMMFLLDVDNFKTVNDTMGHAFGDEVLSTLGEEISSIFRASDIIGRVGGDEFMIFLKGVPTREVVRKEAKKVEDFFKTFQVGENVKYAVRASIGVAVFPHEGTDFETLYKAADQGLYKAKRRGKGQLAFYEDAWGQGEEPQEE